MNTTPTVTIKGQNGDPLIINLEDYDAKAHTIIGTTQTPDAPKFDREAAKAKLKEAGVKFAGNAKNELLKKLVADLGATPPEAPVEKTFAVEPKDDKFVIVDGEGVQIGEDTYDTVEDANTMVSLVKGE